ncbi:MAG TPA: hypothetical protein VEK38_02715 [Candidatus Bathyarchaeia archaeon]|nr:hypothetical protein [Candidatus Bathyarchaeia archaeon]
MHTIKVGIFLGILGGGFFSLYPFGQKAFLGVKSPAQNGVLRYRAQQVAENDADNICNIFFTIEYSHSFRNRDMTKTLFGTELMTFSGSFIPDRNETDLLADTFGLPFDFLSNLLVDPHVTSVLCDISWFQLFSCFDYRAYFWINVPFVHTNWDVHAIEATLKPGTQPFVAGYMGSTNIARSSMPANALDALSMPFTFGDRITPLTYGKLENNNHTNRLAEVSVELGGIFYETEACDLGVYARLSIPAGVVPNGRYLFQPINNNRHHWTFVGGLYCLGDVWCAESTCARLQGRLDVSVGHLFTNTQTRVYDFTNNGNGSRYILTEEILAPSQTLFFDTDQPAPAQYVGRLLPAIELTALKSKINIPVQGNILAALSYQYKGCCFDIGYELFAQSKEKLASRANMQSGRFALKGDAQIYGFTADNQPVALSVTQHDATIQAGQGTGNINVTNQSLNLFFQNSNADNPTFAYDSDGNALNQLTLSDAEVLNIPLRIVNTSVPPILLSNSNINNSSGLLPRLLMNSFFITGNYKHQLEGTMLCYGGAGGCVDVSSTYKGVIAAPSQWRLWLEVGIAF